MHIDDIADDIAHLDLRAIEGAFRAIVHYPGEETIEGATPERLLEALDLICEALTGDTSQMPRDVVEEIEGAEGGTYADGAAAVQANRSWWVAHLHARFQGDA